MTNPIISPYRYNVLQTQIKNILGEPNGNVGYNQSVRSQGVATRAIVLTNHMNDLYTDYAKVYQHQTGSAPATISEVTTADEITEALYAAYEALYPVLFANRFDVDASELNSNEALDTSTRSAQWGGNTQPQSIVHEFKLTFGDTNEKLGFFNAGGEITFSFEMTNPGAGDKSQGWQSMLTNIGTVTFDYTATTVSGSGVPSSTGLHDLTDTYQQIYIKAGEGVAYTDNDLTIEAKTDADELFFKITMRDDAVGTDPGGFGPTDEPVSGTITSTARMNRSDGQVSNPAPVALTLSEL
jgi:hypothetical protein